MSKDRDAHECHSTVSLPHSARVRVCIEISSHPAFAGLPSERPRRSRLHARNLNVESTVSEVCVNSTIPLRNSSRGIGYCCSMIFVQGSEHVHATTLTKQIRVVCRWAYRNCLGGSIEQVAHRVCEFLQFIRTETNLIVDDHVVCRPSSTLNAFVCL